jgi:hypothetical protein
MRQRSSSARTRQGITVLALLLLIIAIAVAAVFLVRYLRSRPTAARSSAAVLAVDLARHPEMTPASPTASAA